MKNQGFGVRLFLFYHIPPKKGRRNPPWRLLHGIMQRAAAFRTVIVELPQFFGHFVLFSPVFLMPFMHCFLDFQLL